MRLLSTLAGFLACAATAAAQETRTASIHIQPVLHGLSADASPSQLAEVIYSTADPTNAELTSFEAPEIPEGAELVRTGFYDAGRKRWTSATTVASVENFSKGYAPNLVVSVDGEGGLLGASLRGVQIDAEQTRDFGPKVIVVVTGTGKQPELNKPVVLSPEGRKVPVQEEKTLFQKYWWVIGIVVMLAVTSGGGDAK